MVITREQQIEARRIKVLELSAQGLTQEEIKQRLVTVSQKTVSNDLAWWKQESINYIKSSGEHRALEFRKVLSNLYQLRKNAWEWFNSKDLDRATKLPLFHIIQHMNADIMNLMASEYLIKIEQIEEEKQRSEQMQKELNELMAGEVENNENGENDSQAVF